MISPHTSHSIDIIRGMGALGVIWGHALDGCTLPVSLNGAFWVWIFLVVSGYLTGKGLLGESYGLTIKGFGSFLRNRALRIVPLYEIALFIGLFMEWASLNAVTQPSSVLQQFLFVSPLNRTPTAGPLWAAAAIFQFYFFSAGLVSLAKKISEALLLRIVLWCAFVVIASICIHYAGDVFVQPRTVLGNIHYFMFGILLSTLYAGKRVVISRLMKLGSIGALILAAWFLYHWKADWFWGFGPYLNSVVPLGGASVCALAISCIVLCTDVRKDSSAGFQSRAFLRCLACLSWCGFYTYGIYVWHAVLCKANQVFFDLGPGISHLVFLLFAVPAAYLSYQWIEAPLLRFKIVRTAPAR